MKTYCYNLDFNISYNKYLQYQSKYPDICVQDFYLEVNIVKHIKRCMKMETKLIIGYFKIEACFQMNAKLTSARTYQRPIPDDLICIDR